MLHLLLILFTIYVVGFVASTLFVAFIVGTGLVDSLDFMDDLGQILDEWRELVQLGLTWPIFLFACLGSLFAKLWLTAPDFHHDDDYGVVDPEGARRRGAGQKPTVPLDTK